MYTLIDQAQLLKNIIHDSSLPKWRRLVEASRTFLNLDRTGLDQDERELLAMQLSSVNDTLESFNIQIDEDWEGVPESGLDEALKRVEDAVDAIIDTALNNIMVELDVVESEVPVEAIETARRHRELIIPRLIEALNIATENARQGNLPEGSAHFLALFLLTELQADEAFPAILNACLLPGELPFDLFGDAITETLSRIFAQFAGDRPEALDDIIENQSANEYVRWAAADAYLHLVRNEHLSRDAAVARLRSLLNQAVVRFDREITDKLICAMLNFAPHEARDDIRWAFDKGLVDPGSWERAEKAIARGEEEFQKALGYCRPTGIPDTIKELKRWAAFRDEEKVPEPTPMPNLLAPHGSTTSTLPTVKPVIRGSRRPGRNEPCPCGSGKKFKKCCLRQ